MNFLYIWNISKYSWTIKVTICAIHGTLLTTLNSFSHLPTLTNEVKTANKRIKLLSLIFISFFKISNANFSFNCESVKKEDIFLHTEMEVVPISIIHCAFIWFLGLIRRWCFKKYFWYRKRKCIQNYSFIITFL